MPHGPLPDALGEGQDGPGVHGRSVGVAKILLAAGADPHAKNADGQTPGDVAQSKGATDLAKVLNAR